MADVAREVFGLSFETLSDAVLIASAATTKILAANRRAAELLGRPVSELQGLAIAALALEVDEDLVAPGVYEDVVLRGSGDFPIYVAMQIDRLAAPEAGELVIYTLRDLSPRRSLEGEVVAKHRALFIAHRQLTEAKAELEHRNREVAMLAWRAAMGEVVAGIAHHLNNPVAALASTLRRLARAVAALPAPQRADLEPILARVDKLASRVETNVGAIVSASRTDALESFEKDVELPPELATALAKFSVTIDDHRRRHSP
ncbi:MAG: hypothetical protein JNL83_10505 [Myxococcales bacterium]|nr:hypothetical protein [Myxococcales bacterium]